MIAAMSTIAVTHKYRWLLVSDDEKRKIVLCRPGFAQEHPDRDVAAESYFWRNVSCPECLRSIPGGGPLWKRLEAAGQLRLNVGADGEVA